MDPEEAAKKRLGVERTHGAKERQGAERRGRAMDWTSIDLIGKGKAGNGTMRKAMEGLGSESRGKEKQWKRKDKLQGELLRRSMGTNGKAEQWKGDDWQ